MSPTSRRQEPRSGTDMLKEALKNPGVNDIVKIYERTRKQIDAAESALPKSPPVAVYTTTDTSPI